MVITLMTSKMCKHMSRLTTSKSRKLCSEDRQRSNPKGLSRIVVNAVYLKMINILKNGPKKTRMVKPKDSI